MTREKALEMAEQGGFGPESRELAADLVLDIESATRERYAKFADDCIPNAPDPIGPLHGAGIALAAKHIAMRIRSDR